MDASRNYQRAVTPTIGEISGSSISNNINANNNTNSSAGSNINSGSSISGLSNNATGGIIRGKPLGSTPQSHINTTTNARNLSKGAAPSDSIVGGIAIGGNKVNLGLGSWPPNSGTHTTQVLFTYLS